VNYSNRDKRCTHGFYPDLCVVITCDHFDGGVWIGDNIRSRGVEFKRVTRERATRDKKRRESKVQP
jgi:hypothetical protein